jgi:CheY-like chemotaxis protein
MAITCPLALNPWSDHLAIQPYMARIGPIIIVDDDREDQEMIAEVIKMNGISNQLKFFSDGEEALQYLHTTTDNPFLIICDINMPVMNGLELRNQINATPHIANKSIPFIFYTTHAEKHAVEKAYSLSVQGFFQKPATIEEMKKLLQMMIGYWMTCHHPSNHSIS